MYTAGKFLQALGLVMVPLALYWGVSRGDQKGAIGTELAILAGAVVVFTLGRALEGRAR